MRAGVVFWVFIRDTVMSLGANSAITEGSFEGIGNGSFYVGLDYSPAFSKIRDFEIMESNGETKAVYPYKKDGKSVKLKAENFDWTTQDPKIGFKDNMLVALEGSVGYGIGGARVELEVGYERFKIKGNRDSGNKEEGSDAVYILAKELAYDVLNTRTSELKTALGNVKGVDIVRFATELKNKHDAIDKKLCKNGNASGGDNTAGECAKSSSNKTGLKSALGDKGKDKWPKISHASSAYDKDSTEQISGEMTGLKTEEKGRGL